ncbi:MAG TPA: NADPH-dependent FMN reductase [Burkholderiaceae bacterium]|nr:NADPH-dependent FMN reductase [Burkholderiaceae bacterium]
MTPNVKTLVRLLGISGSLRRDSYNTTVLHALAPMIAGRAQMTVATLHDVPLYNADLDGDAAPDGVRALKAAITAADGLVVCSPEYNYGIPGVLKNAIDWASRPGFKSPLKGKPVLIVTASPGALGGARAQPQIREVFAATLARPVVRQHVAIPQVNQKLAGGSIVDDMARRLLLEAVDDLLTEIELLKRGAQADFVGCAL